MLFIFGAVFLGTIVGAVSQWFCGHFLKVVTKASLLGGPLWGEASAGVVVYANEVSRGGRPPKGVQIADGSGD